MPRTALSSISDFVARSLAATRRTDADLALLAQKSLTPEAIESLYGQMATGDTATDLRALRREILLTLAAKNFLHSDPFHETADAMSAFADFAVNVALKAAANDLSKRFGIPCDAGGRPQDLLIYGMGKLGGNELNVSSDIDLVFAFDEDGFCKPQAGQTIRREISNAEFFERLGKKVIALISEMTAEGFVFRVDMRLRPNGNAGPLAVSSEMLETYFYSQGREWERFAWLKARLISKPVFGTQTDFEATAKRFDALISAFVYRRYVDFGAMSAISSIHALISEEVAQKEDSRLSSGVNIKLGRGGIREIEFYVQTFQIVRAGKDKSLRDRNTLSSIKRLHSAGFLTDDVADRLTTAYIFLRNLEHVLQLMDDEQTQTVPVDPERFARVAAFLSKAPETLQEELTFVRTFVQDNFDALFEAGDKTRSADVFEMIVNAGATLNEATFIAMLKKSGYDFTDDVLKQLIHLVSGKSAESRSGMSRKNLSSVLTSALKIIEAVPNKTKDAVCARFLRFMEVIAGKSTYVALLAQYPVALKKVVDFIATSSFATDFLMRHPVILDELVNNRTDPITEETPVSWEGFKEDFRRFVAQNASDKEEQLDSLRDAYHGALFKVLAADLEGRMRLETIADHMSALTDAVLELALEIAWEDVATRHRAKPAFAIVAFGKLGGKERGYTGDLDLVFVYEDDHPEAFKNYMRLARRLMTVLTIQTASGSLFEVDLRLRPDGDNGPMVTTFERFCRYEENADGAGAWLWEHQALTRARFAAGDVSLGRKIEAERLKVLAMPRNRQSVLDEIRAMREKMLAAKPAKADLFDIKHDFGGMIDVEFSVQACVLAYASEKPALLDNFGNNRLLSIMADEELIDRELATKAMDAYRAYRAYQKKIRLADGTADVTVGKDVFTDERQTVQALFVAVFGVLPQNR
ncbi:MAG TPA: bifunctional [glutamate--ammonia ligase]-adenylyl-L-tyrosine phosphorylase/[glutamate--ammonia-ligase] adenylyltransferase [Sutterella sp.]|nr:bifunctional [glutamate--ammonia ligase]-adenylyl-L-tyrosine phosphorylase/[glutamate--ammonia-ligase] adenylyltransferase [Sutterella sp.]